MQYRDTSDDAVWLRLIRERLKARRKRIEPPTSSETDFDFDHLELLADEEPEEDGADTYYERGPIEKVRRRTLDDMRRLNEEIKRKQREPQR